LIIIQKSSYIIIINNYIIIIYYNIYKMSSSLNEQLDTVQLKFGSLQGKDLKMHMQNSLVCNVFVYKYYINLL